MEAFLQSEYLNWDLRSERQEVTSHRKDVGSGGAFKRGDGLCDKPEQAEVWRIEYRGLAWPKEPEFGGE